MRLMGPAPKGRCGLGDGCTDGPRPGAVRPFSTRHIRAGGSAPELTCRARLKFLYNFKAGPADGRLQAPVLGRQHTYRRQGRLVRSAERSAKNSGVSAKQLPVSCLEEHLARRGVKHDPAHIQTDDSPVR